MKKFIMTIIFSCVCMHFVTFAQKNGVELSFTVEAINGSRDSIKVTQEILTPEISGNSIDTIELFPSKRKKNSDPNYYTKIDFDQKAIITLNHPGYNDKFIIIDTQVPPHLKKISMSLKFNISLNALSDSTHSFKSNASLIKYDQNSDFFGISLEPEIISTVLLKVAVENEEIKNNIVALKAYNYALQFNKINVDALYKRGLLKIKLNDIEGACIDWHKIKSFAINKADDLLKEYCE